MEAIGSQAPQWPGQQAGANPMQRPAVLPIYENEPAVSVFAPIAEKVFLICIRHEP